MQKLCQKWDSNPRLQWRPETSKPLVKGKLITWVWRLRPLGHPDMKIDVHSCSLQTFGLTRLKTGSTNIEAKSNITQLIVAHLLYIIYKFVIAI